MELKLALDGTSTSSGCKFPAIVPEVLLTEAIEILPLTDKAAASINKVPVWNVTGFGDGSGCGDGDGKGSS